MPSPAFRLSVQAACPSRRGILWVGSPLPVHDDNAVAESLLRTGL